MHQHSHGRNHDSFIGHYNFYTTLSDHSYVHFYCLINNVLCFCNQGIAPFLTKYYDTYLVISVLMNFLCVYINTISSRKVILNGIILHMNYHIMWHTGLGTLGMVGGVHPHILSRMDFHE